MREQWRESEVSTSTIWGTDWDLLWHSHLCHHTLNPSPHCILKVLIITMSMIILSSRLSIMWSISLSLRPNFSLSSMASIKLPKLLRSILQGCIMEKGKGYDNMISYAVVVSVSTSCSRCYNLALSLMSSHVICFMYYILFPHFLPVYIA